MLRRMHRQLANNSKAYATAFTAASRTKVLADSIWTEFTPLAIKHNAVNLGQGFADSTPDFAREAGIGKIQDGSQQYTRSAGDLALVQKLAQVYGPLLQRELNPMTELLVTNGASSALYTALTTYVDHGDEVLMIEPFFDLYTAQVAMAGGVPVCVPLLPSATTGESASAQDWRLDETMLRNAITSKTKIMIVNNPHNPTGKIYTREELQMIANIAIEHNLIVISDEVYEYMVYGKHTTTPQGAITASAAEHIRIATLPGMWERTITTCSAGKSFSVTGWKVGWMIAPSQLIYPMYLFNQYTCFCVNSPLQRAVVDAFEHAERTNYFDTLNASLVQKRDRLCRHLRNAGLVPIVPEGGFFVLADVGNVDFPYDPANGNRDFEFCRWLTREIGIAAIPPSAFYSAEHGKNTAYLPSTYARFCFAKQDSVLDEAGARLEKLKPFIKSLQQ